MMMDMIAVAQGKDQEHRGHRGGQTAAAPRAPREVRRDRDRPGAAHRDHWRPTLERVQRVRAHEHLSELRTA